MRAVLFTPSAAAVLESICDVFPLVFHASVQCPWSGGRTTWSEVACSASGWNPGFALSLVYKALSAQSQMSGERRAALLAALSSLCREFW